jgi:phytoene dehydrogenase-like protein
MDYIQRAFDHAKYGDFSPQPYLDIRVPTVGDASLAPANCHLMSVTAKYAPYQLRHVDWETQRDALGDSVLETLSRYAPDFRDSVLHMQVLTPRDMELVYGLPEGNPNHGEMTLDQFFHMRPLPGYARYRTPIAGLWLCGSGAHPGGGVTGLPGKNAAREVLSHAG